MTRAEQLKLMMEKMRLDSYSSFTDEEFNEALGNAFLNGYQAAVAELRSKEAQSKPMGGNSGWMVQRDHLELADWLMREIPTPEEDR